jgi:hypothetical protein
MPSPNNDYTRAQFEREKTGRMAALAEALKAAVKMSECFPGESCAYEVMSRLKQTADEQFNEVVRRTFEQP